MNGILRHFFRRAVHIPEKASPLLIKGSILLILFAAGANASPGSICCGKQVSNTPDFVAPSSPVLIMGEGLISVAGLVGFFLDNNPEADEEQVNRLANLYIEESSVEGVNSDIAFVQMCLETGFLRFGGLVSPDQNNFCGLGATGPGEPGCSFADERTGVRAHVQHLKAYASTEPPVLEIVDPRYHYVDPKGRSPDIYGLAGTWAADTEYGMKLERLLEDLYR